MFLSGLAIIGAGPIGELKRRLDFWCMNGGEQYGGTFHLFYILEVDLGVDCLGILAATEPVQSRFCGDGGGGYPELEEGGCFGSHKVALTRKIRVRYLL